MIPEWIAAAHTYESDVYTSVPHNLRVCDRHPIGQFTMNWEALSESALFTQTAVKKEWWMQTMFSLVLVIKTIRHYRFQISKCRADVQTDQHNRSWSWWLGCSGAYVWIGRVHVSSPQSTRLRQTSDRAVHDELRSAFRVGSLQTNTCETINTQQVWFRFSQKAVPHYRSYVDDLHYFALGLCRFIMYYTDINICDICIYNKCWAAISKMVDCPPLSWNVEVRSTATERLADSIIFLERLADS